MDVESFLSPLVIDDNCLSSLAIDFSHVYLYLALHSDDQFLATPVNVLPKGTETGRFLAIDVGGTNLRVGFVELLGAQAQGDKIRRSHEKAWSIEDHLKLDNAEELFSWIGGCIAEVVADYLAQSNDTEASGKVLPLGVTFSFPMKQASISEATLMPMGKGFAITSELDLGKMLLEGYSRHVEDDLMLTRLRKSNTANFRRLPNLKVCAITNDTVATLASLAYSAHAWPSSRVAMGLIVGTGTNSSIVMKLSDLHEKKANAFVLPVTTSVEEGRLVVNTEWTINGAAPPLRRHNLITRWDEELDRQCEAPGFQPFEYMTAGRYLGELARLILRDYLVRHEGIPEEHLPIALRQRNAISTFFLSSVVANTQAVTELVSRLKQEIPPPSPDLWQWNTTSAKVLMQASKALQRRSARMISAATIGLLTCAGDLKWKMAAPGRRRNEAEPLCEEIIVAFAGGVITSYPTFLETVQETVDKLVHEMVITNGVKRVVMGDANNGGLIGAGVLAGTVWNLP